ncbi:hypothetical protein J5N97_017725 [Dioscorea zingiberensis]|uniref:Uncharacterized protein n=1 Tax=Dioscorea zingiberensis TaxID=325984 RepID=A0A9D5CPN6_9LILI|nr:hypothetical protein J5N97_017725 [Dioscorea zingiberensis]
MTRMPLLEKRRRSAGRTRQHEMIERWIMEDQGCVGRAGNTTRYRVGGHRITGFTVSTLSCRCEYSPE